MAISIYRWPYLVVHSGAFPALNESVISWSHGPLRKNIDCSLEAK